MKKNRFTEFFKGKGYYVLLFVGVIAIAAVALIGSQLSSKQKNEEQNQVDLNDSDGNIAAEDSNNQQAQNNPVSDGVVNNANNSQNTAANDNAGQKVVSNEDPIELEDYSEASGTESGQAEAAVTDETAQAKPDAVETTGEKVENEPSATEALSFNSEKGLLWPVSGNVIMNYSMDHTIYFATLMQYKCNPAIIIDAKVGTEVKAAADGVVSSIDADNEETGYTVTMNIGDGYSVVYGQLSKDSVKLKVGDSVKEGKVIGTVAEPTKYYTVEGSNLYFMVMENDKTVDPMLLLRD